MSTSKIQRQLESSEIQENPQKRMELMVKYFQEYVGTYHKQHGYRNYSDETFINDILYGLGVAIDPIRHKHCEGFDRFKKKLIKQLQEELT